MSTRFPAAKIKRNAPIGRSRPADAAPAGPATTSAPALSLERGQNGAAVLSASSIMTLQRTVGNQAVRSMLTRMPGLFGAATLTRSPLAKNVEQKDELAKNVEQKDELAKSVGGCGPGCGCAHCAAPHQTEEDGAGGAEPATAVQRTSAPEVGVTRDEQPGAQASGGAASPLLAKASIGVRSGAAATNALGAGDYGLTFPESVDVKTSAKFDKTANTWSPKVTKLTGHYSMQVRLLPGQSEITGPGGNTTQANFCDQVENLVNIGNVVGNTWYMIRAVRRHEQVHEKHFKPALKDAEPAITAALESVTVPHVAKMTKKQALAQLQADASFQAAVTNAQALWLAAVLARAAGDHGGPTDAAEHTVVDPMVATICKHAKKKKWPACAHCP